MMHRPIGRYRSSEHKKSPTSFNTARHLLHAQNELRTVCTNAQLVKIIVLGLGLVVAAAYRPQVSRMSLISYVLNADSGR